MKEMTPEIAVEYLEHYKKVKYGMMPEWVWDMAIKALKQEKTYVSELTQKAYEDGKKDGYVQAKIEQEPKTGHWIRMKAYEKWGCSECNTFFRFTFKEHDYCPNCGADMRAVEE